tara:strand:- start:976 stop:1314 length:339 start_codon:yes stop_codon:yes gene_type:complete
LKSPTLAPKSESFIQDSIDLLYKTESELFALKVRVEEARINPITERELETAIALTGLKVLKFEQRLKIFFYHHGETKEYINMHGALDNFKIEHEGLMEEFSEWFEAFKMGNM